MWLKATLLLFFFENVYAEECDAACEALREVKRTREELTNITNQITVLNRDVTKLLVLNMKTNFDNPKDIFNNIQPRPKDYPFPTDCNEVYARGHNKSAVYRIQPLIAKESFLAYCKLIPGEGGYTVIQHRNFAFNHEDFDRNWHDYKWGFGNLAKNFWLGLEHIYELTALEPQKLLIKVEDWNDNIYSASYSDFTIGNDIQEYVIKVLGTYSGDAGDALSPHLYEEFFTRDRDNPARCAFENGGWWYRRDCGPSNLNGHFQQLSSEDLSTQSTIAWDTLRGANFSAKRSIMALLPKQKLY